MNIVADESVDGQMVTMLRSAGDAVVFIAELDPGIDDEEVLRRSLEADSQGARSYVDGKITKADCQRWLTEYALRPTPRAEQWVRFIERNRAYVINYNLGRDMIKTYMEKRGAPIARQAKAWSEFEALLSSPRLPSGLQVG